MALLRDTGVKNAVTESQRLTEKQSCHAGDRALRGMDGAGVDHKPLHDRDGW